MAALTAPPADIDSLLRRAHRLAGRTLAQLAADDGVDVPDDLRRHKGWVGQLLERRLGAPADNQAAPDFAGLGVELKTLPTDARGKPLESTYVTRVPLTDLDQVRWETSLAREKLQRVLWVPIHAERHLPVGERRVGQPLLWSPNAEEERVLRQDFEAHLARIRDGEVEAITARDGEALQIRPKGANARETTWGTGDFESVIRTRPLGFYLRARFTAHLLQTYFFDAPR